MLPYGMNKKKILLSSNILWTISQFRLGLIKTLTERGYEVVCVAGPDDFSLLSTQKVQDAGARFVRLDMNRKSTDPLQDFQYMLRYFRILRKEKPDLTIHYTIKPVIYGSFAARVQGIPSFAVTTGLGFVFINNNLLTRFTRWLYRFSLRFPERVFFLNTDDKEAFLEHHLVSTAKAALLPGEGIDTDYYRPSGTVKPPREFTFLMIGRLLKEKGVYEFAEAARLLKSAFPGKVCCRLAGYLDADNPGGIKKPQLEEWINEGVISYEVPVEDICPSIVKADCVVLPSYREGVPRTLLEAAALRKPLITTDVPGCRDVVEDQVTGFLCQPRNSPDLFEKMVRMMELSEEERENMGRTGRQKVMDQFDEKIVTEIYLKEIEKVLA